MFGGNLASRPFAASSVVTARTWLLICWLVALLLAWAIWSRELSKLTPIILIAATILTFPQSDRDNLKNKLFLFVALGWMGYFYSFLIAATPTGCSVPSECPRPPSIPTRAAGSLELVPDYTPGGIPRYPPGSLSHRRLAVVVPFIAKQIERVSGNWKLWNPYLGCRLNDQGAIESGAQVSLVMYYDKDLLKEHPLEDGSTIEDYFTDFFRNQMPETISACFSGGIQFLSARLRPDENRHPDGPCLQHFRLHSLLADDYDHFLQLEPDVLPVQDLWIDGLVHETNQGPNCGTFWMKGSMSRCDGRYGRIAERHDMHINGNALYCLGSPEFADFRRRVEAFYPGYRTGRAVSGCATGKWAEDGWDHTWFQFRHQPENFNYAKDIMHKFHYSPFIVNMCEDEYSREAMLAREPSTLLVHSKFQFLPAHEQFVRNKFVEVMGRYSEDSDRKRLGLMTMTKKQVVQTLCATAEHAAWVARLEQQPGQQDTVAALREQCPPSLREVLTTAPSSSRSVAGFWWLLVIAIFATGLFLQHKQRNREARSTDL